MVTQRAPVTRRGDAASEALRALRLACANLRYIACSLADERGEGPESEAEAAWRGIAEQAGRLGDAVEARREVVA